jgi:hypothetical protein
LSFWLSSMRNSILVASFTAFKVRLTAL